MKYTVATYKITPWLIHCSKWWRNRRKNAQHILFAHACESVRVWPYSNSLLQLLFYSSAFLASTSTIAWNADYDMNATHHFRDKFDSAPAVTTTTTAAAATIIKATNDRQHSFHQRSSSSSSCHCIKLRECTIITAKIRIASKPLSADLVKDIRKKACGFIDNEPCICCPPSPPPQMPSAMDMSARSFRDVTSEKPWIWDIVNEQNGTSAKPLANVPHPTNLFNRLGAFGTNTNMWNSFHFHRPNDFHVHAHKPYSNKNAIVHGQTRKIHFFDFEDPHTFRNCPPSQSPDFIIPKHFQHVKPIKKLPHPTHNANADLPPMLSPPQSHSNGFDSNRVDRDPSIVFPSRSNAATDASTLPSRAISKFPADKLNLVNEENCGISIGARIIGGTNSIPGQFPWCANFLLFLV